MSPPFSSSSLHSGGGQPSHWRKLFGEENLTSPAELDWFDGASHSEIIASDEESFVGKLTLFRFDDASDGHSDCGLRVLFSVRAEDEHPDLIDATNG